MIAAGYQWSVRLADAATQKPLVSARFSTLTNAERQRLIKLKVASIRSVADAFLYALVSTGTRLNNLALLYRSMGQYARAEPLLLRAWRIASTAGMPELAWNVQGNLLAYYAPRSPELAIWYGKQAVNTLQAVRAGNTDLDKATQKSFLQKNESTYKQLADLLFTQGRLMEGQHSSNIRSCQYAPQLV